MNVLDDKTIKLQKRPVHQFFLILLQIRCNHFDGESYFCVNVICSKLIIASGKISRENEIFGSVSYLYLSALGLLLADGALIVGRGKTF